MVARRAAENPAALAVSGVRGELTYGELNRRANQLAHYLREIGVRREVVVGLYLDRSPAMAIAALAILKAGGAYLPLDPIHPAERLAFMVQDAQAAVLVSGSRQMEGFPSGDWQIVTVDGDAQKIFGQPETEIESGVDAEDLAYIIYTSGSTGQPKGVELVHGGLSNLVGWHQRAFQVTAADRASAQSTLGFDAAVWELWAYLAAGASLHFPDDSVRNDANAMRDWMVSRQITISFVATAIAERLLRVEWPAETRLRCLLTGADTLKTYPPERLPFVFVNNYGPTECTVVSTSGVVPVRGSASEAPSIGSPIDGVEIYILDEEKRPVRDGAAGEIYVAGANMGRGYRGRPDLTSERFVENPFHRGARMYRTGDVGRWLPNGDIAFLGRVDEQIKVRGYRVEPTEVATVLGRHSAIESCLVTASENLPGEKQLVAYVVPAKGAQLSARVLREFLLERLPDYMVPSAFVRIASVPVTAQGKVNRAALPAVNGNRLSDEVYVEPRTMVEEELVKILGPLLKLDRVGVNDNFFLLGGHSLLGTQVIARVSETFGVDLTLLKLFDHPTVSEMAAEIETLILAKVEQASAAALAGERDTRV
ncbi:MAG TPA: non-ribosomal peptide synthetase [Candidatus Sulfotelmatobacter sp.]|nr:non-ribosomal peptide synthetase [Candidatus Sulfotelmatobacter sp.]